MYILYMRGTHSITFIWGLPRNGFGDGGETSL